MTISLSKTALVQAMLLLFSSFPAVAAQGSTTANVKNRVLLPRGYPLGGFGLVSAADPRV